MDIMSRWSVNNSRKVIVEVRDMDGIGNGEFDGVDGDAGTKCRGLSAKGVQFVRARKADTSEGKLRG
jgi:hypothetical protein